MKISYQKTLLFCAIVLVVLVIDQYVKSIFVAGYQDNIGCVYFVLAYNKGVAFSMFAFLGEYLKYIQIALLVALAIYFYFEKVTIRDNYIAIAFIAGGGIGNVIDRFLHEGVVDYIYWRCGFDFAIFNLADVFINFGLFLLLVGFFLSYRQERRLKKN